MAKQSYAKNLANLNDFEWSNLMKLITGSVMKQFLLNWLDSMAEGVLSDGTTIQEAITELRSGSSGTGSLSENSFSSQFKLIEDAIWWDPPYFSAQYAKETTTEETSETTETSEGITVHRFTTTNAEMFSKFVFDNTYTGEISVEFEMKLVSPTSIADAGVSCYKAVDTTLKNVEDSDVTLSDEWQTITVDLGGSATEYNCCYIGVSRYAIIESGSIVDIKNASFYDSSGTLLVVDEVVGINSVYETYVEGEDSDDTDDTEDADDTEDSDGASSVLSGTRVQHLEITETGIIPTIPTDGLKPGDDDWLDTDIMECELAFNTTDKKVYWRSGDTIITLGASGETQRSELAIATLNVIINYNKLFYFEATNIVSVTENITVTRSNTNNARSAQYFFAITDTCSITFPASNKAQNFEVSDSRWDKTTNTFTPKEDGTYEVTETLIDGVCLLTFSDYYLGS